MTYTLNSIDEAVDGKFLVMKNTVNQADMGTVVHIMGASQERGGRVTVNYRVTATGQDYTIEFESIKDFCDWARPDSFIARNYDSLTKEEIQNYIKISYRTFPAFAIPILVVAFIVIWVICMLVIKGTTGVIIALVASVVAFLVVSIVYKKQKSSVKMKLYRKLQSKWGVSF